MSVICSVNGCEDPQAKPGTLCRQHRYVRNQYGHPLYHYLPSPGPGPRKGQTAERFWRKVDKAGPVPEYRPSLGHCWLWTGAHDATPTGLYGKFWNGTRQVTAYRYSYELRNGPVPEGLEIDHLCRTPQCVRPEHLEAVTHLENMRRGLKAQQMHCIHGHEFTPENTGYKPNGTRRCRKCNAAASARAAARAKARAAECSP